MSNFRACVWLFAMTCAVILVLTGAAQAAVVTDLAASDLIISPGDVGSGLGADDGVQDTTDLSFTTNTAEATWSITLTDGVNTRVFDEGSDGAVVASVAKVVTWDGLADDGTTELTGSVTATLDLSTTSIFLTIDNNPPAITNALVDPTPFSPNNDGKKDTTTFSWTLSENAEMDLDVGVLTPISGVTYTVGDNEYTWNGGALGEGSYGWTLTATDEGGNVSTATGIVEIDLSPPGIAGVSVTLSPFSPNNDGINDTTEINFILSGTDDGTSNYIGTAEFDGAGSDATFTTGPNNPLVSPFRVEVCPGTITSNTSFSVYGSYKNVFREESFTFSASSDPCQVGQVFFDNVAGVRSVSGDTASDDIDIYWYTGNVSVGIFSLGGSQVLLLNESPTFRGNGSYFAQWGPSFSGADGEYIYRITVEDDAGNTSVASGRIVVDSNPIEVINVAASPAAISPQNGDFVADSTTISYEITQIEDRQAQATINIYNSTSVFDGSTLVRTLLNGVLQDAGIHSIVWNGRDNSNAILSPNAEGTYTYLITVFDPLTTDTDQAIGTIDIDNLAPPAPAINPIVSPTNNSNVTVSGGAEAGSTVTVIVNGAPQGTATASPTTGAWIASGVSLTEGNNQITATATDAAGNVGPQATIIDVLLDTVNPVLVSTTPPDGAFISLSLSQVSATVSDLSSGINLALSSITLTKNGAVRAGTQSNNGSDGLIYSLNSPIATDGSDDGSWVITVNIVDNAGNLVSDTATFIVDTGAPTFDVTPADGSYVNSAISQVKVDITDASGVDLENSSITVTDPGGTVLNGMLSDDGSDTLFFDFTIALATDGSVDGEYTIDILIVDNVGTSISGSTNFIYDTINPILSNIVLNSTILVNDSDVLIVPINSVSATLNDITSGVDFSFSTISLSEADGDALPGNLTRSGSQITWALLSTLSQDGDYRINIRGTDLAGNIIQDTVAFSLDNTPPEFTTDPADGSFVNEALTEVSVTFTDATGVDLSQSSMTLTKPGGIVVSDGDGGILSESGAGSLKLTLNAPLSSVGSEDGLFLITVQAADTVGNTIPAGTSQFTYDTKAPVVISSTPGDGNAVNSTADLTQWVYSVSDKNGTSLDVAGPDLVSSSISLTGPDELGILTSKSIVDNGDATGLITWTVSADDVAVEGEYKTVITLIDKAGNVALIEETVALDLTDPEVTFTNPGSGEFVNTQLISVEVTFADEGGIDLENSIVRLLDQFGSQIPGDTVLSGDDKLLFILDVPLAADGSDDGTYTIEIVAIDNAGNTPDSVISVPFFYAISGTGAFGLVVVDDAGVDNVFSPNADGVEDTIKISFTAPAMGDYRLIINTSDGGSPVNWTKNDFGNDTHGGEQGSTTPDGFIDDSYNRLDQNNNFVYAVPNEVDLRDTIFRGGLSAGIATTIVWDGKINGITVPPGNYNFLLTVDEFRSTLSDELPNIEPYVVSDPFSFFPKTEILGPIPVIVADPPVIYDIDLGGGDIVFNPAMGETVDISFKSTKVGDYRIIIDTDGDGYGDDIDFDGYVESPDAGDVIFNGVISEADEPVTVTWNPSDTLPAGRYFLLITVEEDALPNGIIDQVDASIPVNPGGTADLAPYKTISSSTSDPLLYLISAKNILSNFSVLDDLEIDNVFSPDGDNNQDELDISFRVSETANYRVTIDTDQDGVFDSSGATDWVSAIRRSFGSEDITVTWDGRMRNTTGSGFAPDADYKILIEADAENIDSFVIDTGSSSYDATRSDDFDDDDFPPAVLAIPPLVTNVSASPNPFTPNGDDIDDVSTISFDLSETARVSVKLYEFSFETKTIRFLREIVTPLEGFREPGQNSVIWDGYVDRNSDGILDDLNGDDIPDVAPDGLYSYIIVAWDQAGNRSIDKDGFVEIITEPFEIINVGSEHNPFYTNQVPNFTNIFFTFTNAFELPPEIVYKTDVAGNIVYNDAGEPIIDKIIRSTKTYATVSVFDSTGNFILKLQGWDNKELDAYDNPDDPDGTDDPKFPTPWYTWRAELSHTELPGPGRYTVLVEAVDFDGRVAEPRTQTVFLLEKDQLQVNNLAVNPRYYPAGNDINGDNVVDEFDNASISFLLTKEADVSVKIFDSLGTEIKQLYQFAETQAGADTEHLGLGAWLFSWDGLSDIQAGIVPDGNYTVRVTAVNGVDPAVFSETIITIDNTEPVAPTIISPINNTPFSVLAIPVSGTIREPQLDTIELIELIVNSKVVDTAAVEIETGSFEFPAVDLDREGNNIIIARARDFAGNVSEPSVAITVIRDTTAPVFGNLTPADNSVLQDFIVGGLDPNEISATFNDGTEGSGVRVNSLSIIVTDRENQIINGTVTRDDDNNKITFMAAANTGPQFIGEIQITVSGEDNVGNEASRSWVFTVRPFEVTLDTLATPTNLTEVTVTGSTDPAQVGAVVTILFGGEIQQITGMTGVDGNFSIPNVPLTEGNNIISVSVEEGGRVSESGEISLVLDTTKPTVVSVSPLLDTRIVTDLTSVSAVVSDTAGTGINVSKSTVLVRDPDNKVVPGLLTSVTDGESGESTFTYTFEDPLPVDGTYTIEVNPVDNANNEFDTPFKSTFVYTNIPPVLADVVILYDGGDSSDITGDEILTNRTITGVQLTITDALGLDVIPDGNEIIVIPRGETTGVSGTITADNMGIVNGQNQAKLTLTFDQPLSSSTDSKQGRYTVRLQPADSDGNRNSAPDTFSFIFDTEVPEISLTAPLIIQNTSFVSQQITFVQFTLDDIIDDEVPENEVAGPDLETTAATFQMLAPYSNVPMTGTLSNDGSNTLSFVPSLPLATDGSHDGEYKILVTPSDAAGNVAGAPVEFSFVYDTVAPTTGEIYLLDSDAGALPDPLTEPQKILTKDGQIISANMVPIYQVAALVGDRPSGGQNISESGLNFEASKVTLRINDVAYPGRKHYFDRGVSTGLTSTVLSDADASWYENQFAGMELQPNMDVSQTFTVVSNTATTITIEGGNMTTVATAGDRYQIFGDMLYGVIKWILDPSIAPLEADTDATYEVVIDLVDLAGNSTTGAKYSFSYQSDPEPSITEVTIDDGSIQSGENLGVINASATEFITLTWDAEDDTTASDSLAFEFMVDPPMTVFDDVDTTGYSFWEPLDDNSANLYFEDLSLGEHTFMLRAVDSDELGSELFTFTFSITDKFFFTGEVYNYPNPVQSDETRFMFATSQQVDRVVVRVYTISGELAVELESDQTVPRNTRGEISWDTRNAGGNLLASGVYRYTITAYSGRGSITARNKLVIVR